MNRSIAKAFWGGVGLLIALLILVGIVVRFICGHVSISVH